MTSGPSVETRVDAPANASRRQLVRSSSMRALGGLVGALGGLSALEHLAPRRAKADPIDVAADTDPGALIHKLVGRITFGFSTAELARANTLGYVGYLEEQLNHEAITENPALITQLATLPTITYTGPQLADTALVPSATTVSNQLIDATILRAVFSTRQLYERMVEFWFDHFNIDGTVEELQRIKTLDDRAIRAKAMTSFPQLLLASATSPAMLAYLDNDLSSSGSINENYAREIIELHTVGADYFYAYPPDQVQATIVAVARCFTGWGSYGGTFNDTTAGGTGTANRLSFLYNTGTRRNQITIGATILNGVRVGVHDTASKVLGTIFGNSVIPARTNAAGQQDGLDVINMLGAHPATAQYIATKLCRRFLGEGCPQSIIDAVHDTYLNAGNPQGIGDVKAMLRTMLRPNHLAQAFPRLKRPFHLMVSAMRALPTTITSTAGLRQQLTRAGHLPFAWGPPDGYPDTTAYWTGLVLPRWNFGASLVTNTSGNATGISGVTVNDAALLGAATTPAAVVSTLNTALFGGLMTSAERSAIQATMSATPTASQKRDAIGLALDAPSFQWY
jgi:uncharacterized protein (DUF1800 family)